MTPQQIFDIVAAHLRKQGRRAVNDGACMYRTPDGLMCAVGCLIPDELYDPDIEGISAMACNGLDEAALSRRTKTQKLRSVLDMAGLLPYLDLLVALQRVHDGYDMGWWERELAGVANRFNLTYTPPGDQ